ncbi:unnamed protein product [Cunninghamella echinulata]
MIRVCSYQSILWKQSIFKKFHIIFFSSESDGPLKHKLRAIPFTQHIKAAETVFEDFHGHNFFSVHISNTNTPEEIFLPFWVVSATVQTRLKQAQVGRSIIKHRYNESTKRTESYWDTEWAWVFDSHIFSRQYIPNNHPELQIYGSYKYRRGLVNGIRKGQGLMDAQQFDSTLFDRPIYQGNDNNTYNSIQRKLDPYTIYPTTALRFAKSFIRTHEEKLIDNFLCDTYGADKTRLVDFELTMENVIVSPVYYPAYVYTVDYLGRHFRTFINGHDLSVGGIRIYNWKKVAVTSAVAMSAVMALNGGIGYGGASGSFWIGVVLPSLMTSIITMYYPLLSLRVRDLMRQREIESQAKDKKMWDTDWTAAYDAFENEQRYHAWKEEKAYQSQAESNHYYSSSSATESSHLSKDPKGYYSLLGVSPSASKADIQGAFRGLAMKHHPDRYTDPKEKEEAKKKFQVISNAYSVLRDSKKRKIYDTTGRS